MNIIFGKYSHSCILKALKEHKIKEHRESIFPCEGCSRTFLSKSALLLHQPVHSTDLNYQCRSCPEKMRTFRERYVHERTHTTADVTQTPHQCTHCQKQFNTVSYTSQSLRFN